MHARTPLALADIFLLANAPQRVRLMPDLIRIKVALVARVQTDVVASLVDTPQEAPDCGMTDVVFRIELWITAPGYEVESAF